MKLERDLNKLKNSKKKIENYLSFRIIKIDTTFEK